MTALELLRRLVELESPTSDSERLSHIGLFIAAELESIGRARRVPRAPPDGADGGRRAAACPRGPHGHGVADGHADADAVPGRRRLCARARRARHEGGDRDGYRGRAPGRVAGVGPCASSSRPTRRSGARPGRPVVEELSREARAVLVLEPPVRDGTITTSRSGLARYQLRIRGRAAHAGNGWRAGRLGHRGAGPAGNRRARPRRRGRRCADERRPGRRRDGRQRRRSRRVGAHRRAGVDR